MSSKETLKNGLVDTVQKGESGMNGGSSIDVYMYMYWASKVALVVKNPPANAGDLRDLGFIPGLGQYHGGGHGKSLQYSCLENLMDKGVWQAVVRRVTRSWTLLT